jgi:hypothetical protein
MKKFCVSTKYREQKKQRGGGGYDRKSSFATYELLAGVIAQYSTLCNALIQTRNQRCQSEIGFNVGGFKPASIERQ